MTPQEQARFEQLERALAAQLNAPRHEHGDDEELEVGAHMFQEHALAAAFGHELGGLLGLLLFVADSVSYTPTPMPQSPVRAANPRNMLNPARSFRPDGIIDRTKKPSPSSAAAAARSAPVRSVGTTKR